MDSYIIFGAGLYGAQALQEIGSEKVCYFADNDPRKTGTLYHGKKVIRPSEILDKAPNSHIVLAGNYTNGMEEQLRSLGIFDYSIYYDKSNKKYYETEELIVNPYEALPEALTEDEWKNNSKMIFAREDVNRESELIYGRRQLFQHIEIETVNRCNGNCSFCPVNRRSDPREEMWMSEKLFQKIVNQLEELNYDGRFTTFSNNEPLLDHRIIDFNRYARNHLPKAHMHLFTNGTLLTIEKFKALTDVLDELIIDNYHNELKLIKPCEEIVSFCEKHPELKKKVTIVLRNPNEILTSRGGNAPNRTRVEDYGNDKCVLPSKQMIIRPNGKVSLCCNDALGKYTLGDVSKDTLSDIWFGKTFENVRDSLYKGRKYWGDCRYCDTFYVR